MAEFVNCLTTNLTALSREEHHFHALAEDLRARAARPLRLWCNAASTWVSTSVQTRCNCAAVPSASANITTDQLPVSACSSSAFTSE